MAMIPATILDKPLSSAMTLKERMRELRTTSKPIPLSIFLHIYTKANHECYTNYMEGAKVLHSWLTISDGRYTPLDFEIDKYPEIDDKDFKIPRLLYGYEAQQLAYIICNNELNKHKRAAKAIAVTLIRSLAS